MIVSKNLTLIESSCRAPKGKSVNFFTPGLSGSLIFTLVSMIILKKCMNGFYKGNRKQKDGPSDKYSNSNLPGPELISGPTCWDPTGIIGNGIQFLPVEKGLTNVLKWSQSYGDMYKIYALGQPWVVLNSAPAVQTLYRSSEMGHLPKFSASSPVHNAMKPYISNGVVVSTGKLWQQQRKLLLKSVSSFNSLKSFMPLLNRHCLKLISSLGEMFEDGKSHQINAMINTRFLNVICELITGFDSDVDQFKEGSRYYQHLEIWKESVVYRIMHPWFLLTPLWKLHPQSRKTNHAVEEMINFSNKRIREHKEKRLASPINGDTQTTSFRTVLDELLDGGVEESQIVDEINTMILGGHETGAKTTHFFCMCMALNPGIQKECQKEVDELFDDPTNFKSGSMTYDALSSKLKLVERCILETLRLFPPVFIIFRNLQSPLRIGHNGQDIILPSGMNVVVSPYHLHRNPEYFPEPETYDPDRFLPEECAKRHPSAFVSFSTGPRNCLGMKFAMVELKIMTAYILRHFFITATDRMEDIPLLPYITLTPAVDYTFQFSTRSASATK